jgi:hypothetical protein
MVLEKPYYTSIKIIVLMPLIVFFGAMVFKYIFGDETYNVYMVDKIFHFFGGIGISISTGGVLWNLLRREIIVLQDEIVFRFLVFGFLCFVVISWEIYEYIVLYPDKYMTYADLIVDMICGLIGGLIAFLYCIRIKPYIQ